MPLYLISHVTPLSTSQQDTLASPITKLHTELFTTPSLFVNVRFSNALQHVGFVGGKRAATNSISAHVRHGPMRTAELYDKLMVGIADAWARTVVQDPDIRIFVMGDIVAGYEHGFSLPPAGGDKEWMRKNFAAFKEKAKAGNVEMEELVYEINARRLLDEDHIIDRE